MSVEKRKNGDGSQSWRVRWREGDRNRSRSFRTRRNAELPNAAGLSAGRADRRG